MEQPAQDIPQADPTPEPSSSPEKKTAGWTQWFVKPLMLVILITLVNIFMNGLSFGHGDHYSHIPALKHYLDPTHLADDWYVTTLDHLNVRHFFVATLAPLARLVGVPATFLLLQFVVIAAMAWAFMRIGRFFFGNPACWWISLVGVTAVTGEGLGFVSLWAYIARAQDVAGALALISLAFWLERRSLLAGLCLGLTINFHPLLGAQFAVMLGIVHLLSRIREWKHLAALVITSAIAAVPAFWLYIVAASAGKGTVNQELLLDTHYFRVLGRADPLRWTLETWLTIPAFTAALAATIINLRKSVPQEKAREARWLVILPVAVFVLAIPLGVFLEWTALFQPLRTGVWPRVAVWCLIGAWSYKYWKQGEARTLLAFGGLASVLNEWVFLSFWTIVLLVALRTRFGVFLRDKLLSLEKYLLAVYHAVKITYAKNGDADQVEVSHQEREGWRWFLVVIAVIVAIGAIPHWAKTRPAFKSSVPAFSLYVLCAMMLAVGLRISLVRFRSQLLCCLAILLLLTARLPGMPFDLGPKPGRWAHIQLWLTPTNSEEIVATWCGLHLPEGERMIVPPNAESFRLHGEHPVVVNYKCFPFASPDVIEWRRRMLEVCGLPMDIRLRDKVMPDLMFGFNKQSPKAIRTIAKKYNAGVFITRSLRDYPFALLHMHEKWKIYRITKPQPRKKPKPQPSSSRKAR